MRFTPYRLVLILGIAAGLSGCTSSDERAQLYGEDQNITANELEQEIDSRALTRKDNAQTRIGELVDLIGSRLQKLDAWQDNATNISGKARLRLDELRKDLQRLQRDLKNSLDSLEQVEASEADSSEIATKLENKIERSRDELKQINEELNEWREDNLD